MQPQYIQTIGEGGGWGHMEREVRKEMDRCGKRIGNVQRDMKRIIDDIGFYNEENRQVERVLYGLVGRVGEEVGYVEGCMRVGRLLSRLEGREYTVWDIVNRALGRTGISLHNRQWVKGYWGDMRVRVERPDEGIAIHTVCVRMDRGIGGIGCAKGIEEDRTNPSSNLSGSTEEDRQRGFRPGGALRWNLGEETFDLTVDDKQMGWRMPMHAAVKMDYAQAAENRGLIKDIFSRLAWTDETRKHFWREKIGNKLRITRGLYNSLVDRLNTEGICKRAEKTIIDDLNRTFPQVEEETEGIQMYSGMKQVLSLFEVDQQSSSCTGRT